MAKKIVIVGGVAGGASAAARLRRLSEESEIILLEKGEYISFANCGLPYYIGGEITDRSALTLQTPESFRARFNVDVRVQNEVTRLDPRAKTVEVKDLDTGRVYTETYDQLILSPGAAPVRPPIEGVNSPLVFTLRTIPDTYRITEHIAAAHPHTAVVVGGGYIGVEMAENLCRAGLEVTLVEFTNQVIAPLDYDMACDVHRHMRDHGVRLMLGCGVKAIRENGTGLDVTVNDTVLSADMLILSVGVRPETALAREAGLQLNARGAIVVDDRMRTSAPDVYAVGDAVEVTEFVSGAKRLIALAGPANRQGRIAADNICGGDSRYTGTQGSAILKVFDMTVATTGLNEKAAKELNIPYEKSFTYSGSHASYYPGSTSMSVKVLFDPATGKLLGAQLVGFDGVDKRCDVLAAAIRLGATAYDLTRLELCYAPPFSSAKDPVNMAGFVIENVLTGKVKLFHWHDVASLPRDGSVTLLDVRTAGEYAEGHIDGFINIPLDSLRGRLSELDPSRTTYVHCFSGLRSYLACRILTQHGFDCRNLSGGYRLWHSVCGDEGCVSGSCCGR